MARSWQRGMTIPRSLVWDFSNPAAPILLGQPFINHAQGVASVIFSPDGKILASGSSEYVNGTGSVRLWDLSNPAIPAVFGQAFSNYAFPGISSLAFSPDGKILVSGVVNWVIINLWDISAPAEPILFGQTIISSIGSVFSVAISPDGKTLAAGCSDATIRLFDLSDPAAPVSIGEPLTATYQRSGKCCLQSRWQDSGFRKLRPYGDPLGCIQTGQACSL